MALFTASKILPVAPSIVASVSTVSSDLKTPSPAKDPLVDKVIASVIDPPSPGKIPMSPLSPLHSTKPVIPGKAEFIDFTPEVAIASDIALRSVDREKKNFNPLGDTSGITSQRPIVLAVTQFNPLFVRDVSKDSVASGSPFTDMGNHFLDQFFTKKLIWENIARIVDELGKAPDTANKVALLNRGFRTGFEKSIVPVQSLFLALRSLEALKKEFEFKRYEAVSSTTIESLKPSVLKSVVGTHDTAVATLSDVFTDDLKFSDSAFRKFSNTKVIYQLIYELQHFARNHSYDLVKTDVSAHTSDDTDSKIVKNYDVTPKFSVGFMERFKQLKLTQSDLVSLFSGDDKEPAYKRLQAAFKYISSELPTNTVEKIQLLALLVSREFRCSSGLSNVDFQNRLRSAGFDPDSEKSILEQLAGDIPESVTDVLLAQPRGALSNVAQIRADGAAVLPFETKFIDSENGTYTPGSLYMIDSIVNDPASALNTDRLKSYVSTLSTCLAALQDTLTQLKLVNSYATPLPMGLNRSDVFFFRLFSELLRATMSTGDLGAGILVGTQNEVLVSTFAQAAADDVLKSQIFALLWDADSAELDTIIDVDAVNRIFNRVTTVLGALRADTTKSTSGLKKTPLAGPGVKLDFTELVKDIGTATRRDVSEEEFRAAFSSAEFKNVKALFKSIASTFEIKKSYTDAGTTRLSKVNSIAVQMLLVDEFVSIASRFMFSKFKLGSDSRLQVESSGSKIFGVRTVLDKLAVAPDLQQAIQVNNADELDAVDPQLRQIAFKLNDEEMALKKIYISLVNLLSGVIRSAETTLAQFAPGTGVHAKLFDDLSDIIDKRLVNLLDAAQIRLASFKTLDTTSRVVAGLAKGERVTMLDDTVMQLPTLLALGSALSEKRFQQLAAQNLRIISVGLPAGFSKQLQERVDVRLTKGTTKLQRKEQDVVTINVYKRDAGYPEIVFKPQKVVFELSRFVFVDSAFALAASKEPSFMSFSKLMEIARTVDLGDTIVSPDVLTSSDKDLRDSSEYDFLSPDEKEALRANHVMSALLTQYIKMISGVSLDESAFPISFGDITVPVAVTDPALLKELIEARVKTVANIPAFDAATDSVSSLDISAEKKNKIACDVKHLAALAFSRTTLGDPTAETKAALTPKLFERIFNVPVDPDDFLVDVELTRKSTSGAAALDAYVASGEFQHIDDRDGTVTSYALADKNRQRTDTVLEQYFVTISTTLGTST